MTFAWLLLIYILLSLVWFAVYALRPAFIRWLCRRKAKTDAAALESILLFARNEAWIKPRHEMELRLELKLPLPEPLQWLYEKNGGCDGTKVI